MGSPGHEQSLARKMRLRINQNSHPLPTQSAEFILKKPALTVRGIFTPQLSLKS